MRMDNLAHDYSTICQQVLAFGEDIAPRGQNTKELRGVTLVLSNPHASFPPASRNANMAIGAVEALSVIGGVQYPQLLAKITSNFTRFFDGEALHGAYGPRLRPQLGRNLELLRRDPDSRQAVSTIWDPHYDQLISTDVPRDLPCTTQYQFLIRNGKLELHVTMRSNDVWWGLTYDVFMHSQVQIAMARALDLEPGPYTHHVASLHAYERDWESIRSLEPGRDDDVPYVAVGGENLPWTAYQKRARALLEGRLAGLPHERWYVDTLAPYVNDEDTDNG